MGPLAQYAAPECLQAITTPDLNTDIAMIVLQSLISRMEVMADGAYCVEHDQSKNLATYHEFFQRLIQHDDPMQFRATDITTLRFPLKLTKVSQMDSKESPAVQLADVLIGAAVEAVNNLVGLHKDGLNTEQLLTLYADEQLIHMLPSIDFEEQRRFRQCRQMREMIDYFATHFIGPTR